MLGLSHADSDAGIASLDYAIYLAADGWVYIVENGVRAARSCLYAWNDKLRIERSTDGHVVYKKNGVAFYNSSIVSTAELRVDTTFTRLARPCRMSSCRWAAALRVRWTGSTNSG